MYSPVGRLERCCGLSLTCFIRIICYWRLEWGEHRTLYTNVLRVSNTDVPIVSNTAIGLCPLSLKSLVTAIFSIQMKQRNVWWITDGCYYYHRYPWYLVSLGICWSTSGNSLSWNWYTVMRGNGNQGWDDLWDPQKLWRGQGEACSWRSVTVLGRSPRDWVWGSRAWRRPVGSPLGLFTLEKKTFSILYSFSIFFRLMPYFFI